MKLREPSSLGGQSATWQRHLGSNLTLANQTLKARWLVTGGIFTSVGTPKGNAQARITGESRWFLSFVNREKNPQNT